MTNSTKKFFVINEGFVCEKCGAEVSPAEVSCRDHCPFCLWGKHVDVNPGDRANECGGLLRPVRVDLEGKKGKVIGFVCERCGAEVRCKSCEDDSGEEILGVMRRRVV